MREVPGLAKLAIDASELADSYRNLRVGAVLVAERAGQIGVFAAANRKPVADSVKECAEMQTLGGARKARFSVVRGIVVAGPSDLELITGITNMRTPTLHPCDVCLTRMDWYEQEGQLRIPDTTPVVTLGQKDQRYQVHTVGELQALYGLRDEPSLDRTIDSALFGTSFELWEQSLEAANALPAPDRVNPAADMRTSLVAAAAMQVLAVA